MGVEPRGCPRHLRPYIYVGKEVLKMEKEQRLHPDETVDWLIKARKIGMGLDTDPEQIKRMEEFAKEEKDIQSQVQA